MATKSSIILLFNQPSNPVVTMIHSQTSKEIIRNQQPKTRKFKLQFLEHTRTPNRTIIHNLLLPNTSTILDLLTQIPRGEQCASVLVEENLV
ncbi:hypothetical protein Droror1_Dr00016175 [Drosera rotundifolia]